MSRLVGSSAWHNFYGLPICPGTANPWIYGAYALKVARAAGITSTEEISLLNQFQIYAHDCEAGERGLYHRTPEGDRWTSHDELMGIAYVAPDLARPIIDYLSSHDGFYANLPEDREAMKTNLKLAVQLNFYRFPWLLPYLKACAGYWVNPFSQVLFALHLLNDMRVTKSGSTEDAGGRLRIWIMLEAMEKLTIAGVACSLWKKRMNSLGYSPKNQLAIEPREHPILSELAPESF